MNALGGSHTALGIADDPAHRVARGNRSGADELFPRFQRDIGDFTGRSIDLVEGTLLSFIRN
jgi:hypothetical protein